MCRSVAESRGRRVHLERPPRRGMLSARRTDLEGYEEMGDGSEERAEGANDPNCL